MLDIVKWVLITVQPKRWPIETRAPLKQSAVKAARGVAAGSHPSAHKIDNAKYLIRVHASISNGQDATARLPPDQDTRRSNVRALSKRGHGRPDIVQRPLSARQRYIKIACITLPAIRGKSLIVKTIRLTSTPALGECDDPTSIIQKVRETDIEQGCLEQRRIGAVTRRTMVEHRQRERPHSVGSEDHHLEIDRLAVLDQSGSQKLGFAASPWNNGTRYRQRGQIRLRHGGVADNLSTGVR